MTVPAIAASTIAQQAFREMELSPLNSFDDDSEQAQAAAEQYPEALGLVLETADWSFASVLAELSASDLPLGSAVDATLPYFYAPPGDAVKVRECGPERQNIRWRRDRDGLRSEQAPPLRLRYTAMIADETQTSASFRLAVALQLAILLAPRWLGTATKIDALKRNFEMKLKKAQREDARNASDARYDNQPETEDWANGSTW